MTDLSEETRRAVRARILWLIGPMDLRALGLVLDQAETLGARYAEWRLRWLSADGGFVRLSDMVLDAGVCGSCFREPGGGCECGRPEKISQGQALLRLRSRWETSAPTVPELRWYLAYELRVEIARIAIERLGVRQYAVRVKGPLSVPARWDLDRLRLVIAGLIEPGTRVAIEEVVSDD